MAYYAALVSLLELLKAMSLSELQHPKSLFQKQQITCLYEKFSHLQELLEDYYSPNDEEAAGFLERLRDVACRVELFIERQTSDAACENVACRMQLMKQKAVNEGVFETTRKGYQDLLKLREVLGHVVGVGYEDLENLKEEVDSVMGEGYLDVAKLKEEIDSISAKGYQELVKLNGELDAISSKGYQDLDSVEQVVDSIVRKGDEDSERVKEEVDSVVGKGYDDLLENVLKKEVDPIVEELMMRIKNSHTTRQEDLQVTIGGPSDDGTTMVVLDENPITTIKDQILGDSSKLEVISIVGMGGIGKTTLARYIFDDKHIRNRFDFHVWATVSQNYHLSNILRAIAKSLNIRKMDLSGVNLLNKSQAKLNEEDLSEVGEDVLKESIYKYLFGRRYLIIMDDIWDTKILDDLKWIFPTHPNGSRITITTRQSDVASVAAASDFINQIPILTQHQSWTLFCEKVLCPPELEDIGRLIVKHCGGLPLAIVVVAGLLSKTSKTRDHWGDIARRVSSTAAVSDERFSKVLSLSYDRLPHYLKPCFLYLGGFPEDYEISISRLIKLWVAEGFLKPIASKCLEEVAEEYLEDLVKRNLVLVAQRRSNGKSKSCIMHDLLRDLCLERARQEHFLLLPHEHNAVDHHTHRFFIHPDSSSSDIAMRKNNARSIVSCGATYRNIKSYLSNFKSQRLRVLDAPFIDDTFLADRVCELLNLRFLVLRYPGIIPSSILQLQHLQTLIARSELSIYLPAEIWKMPQLRHVRIDENLIFPDGGRKTSDRLPSLQTLSTLRNFTFTSRIAEMIPSIKKLKLKYVFSGNVWTRFGLTNLIHLHQLETLAIATRVNEYSAIPFPEGFAFPSNLRELTLKGCHLPWRNMTVVGALPHLQVLKLREYSFFGEEWESKEGEFPKLKFLLMEYLLILENWRTESTHFPCLEHLVIRHCKRLEGIPSEIGEFPNLKLIELESNNSQVEASALEIQEEQSSIGNETLQVRIN